jgi:hypothetical protein
MKHDTTMSTAFNRAGLSKHYMTAYAQAAQFIKSGGTRDEWIKAFDAAAEKIPREGHEVRARNGQQYNADPRSPKPSEGQLSVAGNGQREGADAGSPMPREGRRDDASNGQDHVADPRQSLTDRSGQPAIASHGRLPSAAPVREPSPIDRAASAKVMRLTIFDTFKIYDGQSIRSIGDFRRGELAAVRMMNLQHASVIDQILGHARADSDMKVRAIVKEQDLQRFIQEASRRTGAGDAA